MNSRREEAFMEHEAHQDVVAWENEELFEALYAEQVRNNPNHEGHEK